MGEPAILSSIFALMALNLFPVPESMAALLMSEQEIARTVGTLINSQASVHVQEIKVGKDQGQINLEISANLGNCWGKEEYAKRFARDALGALFTSDLPVSHVLLNIYQSNQILLTVALGRNQADTIDWSTQEPLNAFYERLRSRTNYQGDPADSSWIVEMRDGLSR